MIPINLAGIHSFLEIWPISSSWHLEYFFSTSKEVITSYHLLLLPIVTLLIFLNRKKLFFDPFYIFCLLSPSGGIYILKALKLIPLVILSPSLIHFMMGIVLLLIAIQQLFSPFLKKTDPLIILIFMSITQSLNIIIPGLSRWGCSLLPFLFIKSNYKNVFWQTLFLDFLLLIAGFLKDYDCLFNINIIDLYFASGFFLISTVLGLQLGWFGILLSGLYRIALSILLK